MWHWFSLILHGLAREVIEASPVVHESYKVLLPLLPQNGKDFFCFCVQQLALLSNLVCQRFQFCKPCSKSRPSAQHGKSDIYYRPQCLALHVCFVATKFDAETAFDYKKIHCRYRAESKRLPLLFVSKRLCWVHKRDEACKVLILNGVNCQYRVAHRQMLYQRLIHCPLKM